MSKLEQLIKEKCPNGVEYKKIWEVTTWDKKYTSTEKYMQPKVQKYKYLLANQINDILDENGNVFVLETGINAEKKYTTEKLAKDYLCEGEVVAIPWGGTPNVKYYNGKFVTGDNRIAISNDTKVLLNKFLYYFLDNNINIIKKIYRGSGIKHPEMKKILMLNIPIPPIEVQKEIVKTLDKFNELETELEAELETRKKQYEFFRKKLLNKNYKKYKLENMANFTYGYTGKALEMGDVRYIRITDISDNGNLLYNDKKYLNTDETNKKYILKKGDLVVARTGASYGKTLFFNDEFPGIYASFLIKIELNNNIVLNKYYWHFSKSLLYWNQANNLVSTAGQPQFNSNALKKIIIPIPPLQEQEFIVKTLDKFDKLINDISEGIPAEIEARRKQYEYYRNKLLNFEELKYDESAM